MAYLDIDDLLNVADTSMQMRAVATLVAQKMYTDGIELVVNSFQNVSFAGIPYRLEKNNCFQCNEARFTMRFLRCFGHCVTELTLNHRCVRQANHLDNLNAVIDYAKRFSNISLQKFKVVCISKLDFSFGSATQPFVNVTEISFFDCTSRLSKEHFKL